MICPGPLPRVGKSRGPGQVNFVPNNCNANWPAQLVPPHREQLAASGISPEVAAARGYRSVKATEAFMFGFAGKQARSGLLIPVYPPKELSLIHI